MDLSGSPNLPAKLTALLAAGVWPRTSQEELRQNLHPLVSAERVRMLAPEESTIFFQAPPFRTIADEAADPDYRHWWLQFGALNEIAPHLAVVLGDFGLGSDAAIVLDYRLDAANPTVLRLRWSADGSDNHWVELAADFAQFAEKLGLSD